jgi:SAM-dependent methyltransferase
VRVLDVGCGQGDLARALQKAGYTVLGIDPEAPDGPIFRRIVIEELADVEPFVGVVASYSLHHVESLDLALDRIASLLEPKGRLVVDEFGWDRVDPMTAAWYGRQQGEQSVESVLRDWKAEHEGLHRYAEMRRALDRRFVEDFFEWRPYLYRLLEGDDHEATERAAICEGEIRAVGFRYVGRRP